MDSNLRVTIRKRKEHAEALSTEHETNWLNATNQEYRRQEYQFMMREFAIVDVLNWVLGLLDTVPVSTVPTRPPSAAERIEAWLALHPEDNALSHRELGKRVGLSKTAVANWRTASTSVHNAEPVLE